MSPGRHQPRTAAVRVERQRWPMEPTLLHAPQQKADEKLRMPSPPPVVVCVCAPRRGTCQQWPKSNMTSSQHTARARSKLGVDRLASPWRCLTSTFWNGCPQLQRALASPCSAASRKAWATPQSLHDSLPFRRRLRNAAKLCAAIATFLKLIAEGQ